MDIEQSLSEAELYIRQNQTSQARTILGQILHDNPQNEEAWILSAQASDKPEQVIYCLRQAIKINPVSSRALLLLERLQLPHTPPAPVISSQPESGPLPDTQPMRAVRPAVVQPEEVAPIPVEIAQSASDDHLADVPDRPPAVPEMQPDVVPVPGSPAPIPDIPPALSEMQPDMATVPSMPASIPDLPPAAPDMVPAVAAIPAGPASSKPATRRRPQRWLQRVLTMAASASLLAPWITVRNGENPSSTVTGVQVLLGPIFSPLGVDVGIAGLALLAGLVLLLLMFFRFKTAAAQKWGERATIALAPLASVLCLDMLSFYYGGLTNDIGLRWGIWASGGLYSLAGLTALINALRLGRVGRAQLFTARAGWIFTWLFTFGDILAILVTMIGLVLVGKFSLFGIAIPCVWLGLGALLSHLV